VSTAMPVFSSSHGEICKSLAMLKAIQAGDEVSPAAFSLSAHNPIADFYPVSPLYPQHRKYVCFDVENSDNWRRFAFAIKPNIKDS